MNQNSTKFSRSLPWIKAILIIAVTFAVYSPIHNAGFIWDDDFLLTNNPLLNDLKGLWKIWATTESYQYYPLVFSTFWVEKQFWALNPLGYHIVNVLFHSLNSILIWQLFRKLNIKGSWLIGLIFAIHPVHVESVAWISERKNVLSGFFYLLTIHSYIEYEKNESWRLYFLSIVLFLAALLSKTVTSTLPAILILLRWFRGYRVDLKYISRLIPLFSVGTAMGMLTVFMERQRVGAEGHVWNISILEKLLLPGRVLYFYIIKLICPVKLSFIYERWNLNPAEFIQWIPTLLIFMAVLAFWFLRGKLGRGPFSGLVYFIITLFPALGFFNVYPMRYSFVADHFQYLATVGIIALLISSIIKLFYKRYGLFDPRLFTSYGFIAGLVILTAVIALGTATWKRSFVFRSSETVWNDTLLKNPRSWIANNNLGLIYYEKKDYENALKLLQKAIETEPENMETYNNIGVIYFDQKQYAKAMEFFLKAIEINPNYADAHNNLGSIYYAEGNYENALQELQTALPLARINKESIQRNIEILKRVHFQEKMAQRLIPKKK